MATTFSGMTVLLSKFYEDKFAIISIPMQHGIANIVCKHLIDSSCSNKRTLSISGYIPEERINRTWKFYIIYYIFDLERETYQKCLNVVKIYQGTSVISDVPNVQPTVSSYVPASIDMKNIFGFDIYEGLVEYY